MIMNVSPARICYFVAFSAIAVGIVAFVLRYRFGLPKSQAIDNRPVIFVESFMVPPTGPPATVTTKGVVETGNECWIVGEFSMSDDGDALHETVIPVVIRLSDPEKPAVSAQTASALARRDRTGNILRFRCLMKAPQPPRTYVLLVLPNGKAAAQGALEVTAAAK